MKDSSEREVAVKVRAFTVKGMDNKPTSETLKPWKNQKSVL